MVDRKPSPPPSLRSGAELIVVFALVLIAAGLVVVLSVNLSTSAKIRDESAKSHALAELQIALTTVEEVIAAWQVDPGRPHPAIDPEIADAVAFFDEWHAELVELVDGEELLIVNSFSAAFDGFIEAANNASAVPEPHEVQTMIGLNLAARRPLLELLEEENDHLLASVEADRKAELWLRWGMPTLLILALVVLTFVVRLRARGRQLSEQRRLNEAQSEFIGSVSHELRTPLTSVVAYSHELRDRFDDFSRAELGEMVQALVQESDEVAAIVDDLLVAARLDTDHLVIRLESLDVREEIEHALDTISDVQNVAVAAAGRVSADQGRLRQILRNLVSNARRYGGEQIRITGESRGGEMLIVVADSGPEVPADLQAKIFEPFTSAGSGDSASTSVGLGLTVSRNLAELMGGSLWYSHEDGWSRMNLRLPEPPSSNRAAELTDPVQLPSNV